MMWFLFLSSLYFVVPSYSIHHAIHLAYDLATHLAYEVIYRTWAEPSNQQSYA